MSMKSSQPALVQAQYSFKGTNNDELCFKKGDIITITQFEEGGWWEGTLGDKTGWFPANYVKEYKVQGEGLSPIKTSKDLSAQQKANRNVVIKDFIDTERTHINELKTFVSTYLTPIEQSNVLSGDEYREVVGNLDDVVNVSEAMVLGVEGGSRMGRHLLGVAPQVKEALTKYCSHHPTAIATINRHKAKVENLLEGNGCNLLGLTGGLSRPFRRLEKYSGHLQELERHMDESHPDRGDTQRAIAVYKDIATTCTSIRRQKELEQEILSGGVRGWEGRPLSQLGPILHLGSVAVGPQHADRYLVLFSSTLLVLSVSPRISAFIYEGKLPLTGIQVVKLDDTDNYKNAFEISGPLIETIVAVCQTKEDQTKWVSLIKQQSANFCSRSFRSEQVSGIDDVDATTTGSWSITRLRPSPPVIFSQVPSSAPPSEENFEEDAQILQVIEAYCSTPYQHINRFLMNSDSGTSLAQLKKDLKNGKESVNSISLERVLTEVVVGLQDKLANLDTKLSGLTYDIAAERSAREKLQAQISTIQPSSPAP